MLHRAPRGSLRAWLAMLSLALPASASADISIRLRNSFIEKYRDRATIEADFIVDKAHKKPNAPSKDGDLHVAGRASNIGLPIVAELMNAKLDTASVDAIHAVEGTGQKLSVAGVWRIWCEHGGSSQQIQGTPLEAFTTTNPDHVFEIHPLTKVGTKDTRQALKPIEGFTYKDAADAFWHYENTRSTIVPGQSATTIETAMAGYNYVEFKVQPRLDTLIKRADGHTVMASVLATDGELLVRNRRIVFVGGTEPDDKLQTLSDGECLHVLGIPRISLRLVTWRMSEEGRQRGALNWNLPYEMVIVALLSDSTACDTDE